MELIYKPEIGQSFDVVYPFIKHKDYEDQPEFWKPGTRIESISYEIYREADGEGVMRMKVVGIYKPPGYQTRIFFMRQFFDPRGFAYAKAKMQIVGPDKFRRLVKGYALEYDLPEKAE